VILYSFGASSGTENNEFNCSDAEFLVKYGIKNFDWSTVAGVVRVLRVIYKYWETLLEEQKMNVCT